MQQDLIPFKIKQGISANLSLKPFSKGTVYYCIDTKDVYIDIIHPSTGEEVRQHINSLATSEVPGLMSPEDKIKLDEMTTGNTIMVHYDESKIAVAGQTEFLIDLPSFDFKNDMVEVYSGRTRLSPILDYTITANSVILEEGLPEGRTVDLRIIRKVFLPGGEEMYSGTQILPGSIPLDRLDSSEIGGKLTYEHYFLTAETDGQTVFTIPLETLDPRNDLVIAFEGQLHLAYEQDFTLNGNIMTLVEGVQQGCTIAIYVIRQLIQGSGEEDYILGNKIMPGTIPLDRLAESIQMDKCFIRHDVTGELYRLGLDDTGLYTIKQS